MDIRPLGGGSALPPVAPVVDSDTARGSDTHSNGSAALAKPRDRQAADPYERDLAELEKLTTRTGLELRIEPLPDSDVTVIKMVEPGTGRVVREFPPEGLATVLAQLRARAAARLDHKA
jgi:uncharacterized FlaG/YvyC family protein